MSGGAEHGPGKERADNSKPDIPGAESRINGPAGLGHERERGEFLSAARVRLAPTHAADVPKRVCKLEVLHGDGASASGRLDPTSTRKSPITRYCTLGGSVAPALARRSWHEDLGEPFRRAIQAAIARFGHHFTASAVTCVAERAVRLHIAPSPHTSANASSPHPPTSPSYERPNPASPPRCPLCGASAAPCSARAAPCLEAAWRGNPPHLVSSRGPQRKARHGP